MKTIEYEIKCSNCEHYYIDDKFIDVNKKRIYVERCKRYYQRYNEKIFIDSTHTTTSGIYMYLKNEQPCHYFTPDNDKIIKSKQGVTIYLD